jgi:hypothetical protein
MFVSASTCVFVCIVRHSDTHTYRETDRQTDNQREEVQVCVYVYVEWMFSESRLSGCLSVFVCICFGSFTHTHILTQRDRQTDKQRERQSEIVYVCERLRDREFMSESRVSGCSLRETDR